MSDYYSRERLVYEMLTRVLVKIGDDSDIRWLSKHVPEAKTLIANRDVKTQHLAVKPGGPEKTLSFETMEQIMVTWATESRAFSKMWKGSPVELMALLMQQNRLSKDFSPQQIKTVLGKVVSQSTAIPALVRCELDESRRRIWIFEFLDA